MTTWPSVGVVLPTHSRPAELRAALASVLTQDYPGEIRAAVVFDGAAPDESLAGDRVVVLANDRTPGLAGARNTGILALDTDLIAFCDDDDTWFPGKLAGQVTALRAVPDAEFASCAIAVRFDGKSHPRLAGTTRVTHAALLRSRMVMVHSSTYLARRSALLGGLGLVNETIPASQNEDWDLALRAAARRPIVNVDQPLVEVAWGAGSHYSRQWESKALSLLWMLEQHSGIAADRAGAARVYAQIAFAYACLGERRNAWRWAVRALRHNWHERRVPFALAVAAGAISGERVLRALHAHGHGI